AVAARRPGGKRREIVGHGWRAAAVALAGGVFLRFQDARLDERIPDLPRLVLPFIVLAGFVYAFFGLYKSRWRFASLPDLSNIVKASTVLALALLVIDYVLTTSGWYDGVFIGKVTILLYWMLQIFCLGGPRVAYRYGRYVRSRDQVQRLGTQPALIVGRAAEAEIILRAMESGGLKRMHAAGILSPRQSDLGQSIRGVALLGRSTQLEKVAADLLERGIKVKRVILAPSALAPDAEPETLLAACRRLGVTLSRFQTLEDGVTGEVALAPVEIEDLLLRPTVETDRVRLENLLRGRRVAVTGGGGSIGSEIALRVAAFGASDLLVIENSEPALHQITETLLRQG
ncbi:polysaccharide biosynthesis protein, partial [Nostoc sp. NIES-2111]